MSFYAVDSDCQQDIKNIYKSILIHFWIAWEKKKHLLCMNFDLPIKFKKKKKQKTKCKKNRQCQADTL